MCQPTKIGTPLLVDVQQVIYLWNVLRILLFGKMVSLEEHPVFLDCYKLALRSAFSCKTLQQCMK